MKYKIGDVGFMNVNDGGYHYKNKPCKIYNIYNGAFKHPYAVEFIIGGKRGTFCISDFECIWEKKVTTSLKVLEHEIRTEKLFIHKSLDKA